MSRRAAPVLFALLFGACTIGETFEALDDRSPPPEFGRPVWVRVPAGIGAWIGGIAGGVVSIVTLPVTFPISLIAGDDLGEFGKNELIWFPAMAGASVGHAFLGTPVDIVDYMFRRVWVEPSPPLTSYEFVPMEGAALPKAPGEAAGTGGADANTKK
jgi:hypothetical protein